jgi:hypothetical protein
MTTKRVSLLAGTILGGALLLGTAGLVFAQDPTSTPGPASVPGMSGGMMGGQGMMGGGMGAGQMPDMAAMHAAMGQDGTCDPDLMQSMHEQYHPTR